jgi:signal transduction histidine kinase
MRQNLTRIIDYFIPPRMREDQANLMKVRAFVLLHLVGPAMGHSVVLFLWSASNVITWEFWVVEVGVAFFWLIPLVIKFSQSLVFPASLSVQALVFLSLFGSFYYGGISSPFMPWFLIALLLGFFYLAEHAVVLLAGVAAQLAAFVGARLLWGSFPTLLEFSSLTYVNLISILAAITYTTLLSLYYETVMRDSSALEQATRGHRARMEALSEALRRAEVASHQKSIFLAKISHELRTPLNAVIGYSEMLRDDLPPERAKSQRALDLERINAAGRHLLALVTDVLDLTTIESEKMNASVQVVEVSQVIRDVAATAAPLIGKRHNTLNIELTEDLGAIETDPLKLRQCILNLLSNAAKFTSHGSIKLAVRKNRGSAGQRLIVEVGDTGIGMSQESLSRLFENFSQAELDTSEKFGGTGLGLALTQRFCRLMGGSVSVESTLGKGTTFTIELPYGRAVGRDHPAAAILAVTT